jgi:hypothetical protein
MPGMTEPCSLMLLLEIGMHASWYVLVRYQKSRFLGRLRLLVGGRKMTAIVCDVCEKFVTVARKDFNYFTHLEKDLCVPCKDML